jgi:predicted ArsR family transcriptional regulator
MQSLTEAKHRLIDQMKRLGPSAVDELAARLDLTGMAVRQHLQALEKHGLVRAEPQPPEGRGRPRTLWSLTPLAEEIFPDHHAELTDELLTAAREAFGEEGLDQLLAERTRRQLASYRHLLPGAEAPLGERVEALARQRTAEGYMAEAHQEGPGHWTLVEHHCPICTAARSCAGFCRSELEVFRAVLGDDVHVERTRHLLSDDDRCLYRITTHDGETP